MSAAARTALTNGGELHARLEIRDPATGGVVADSATGALLVERGAITDDWTRPHRRTLALTITEPANNPELRKMLSVRGGYDLAPYTGWRHSDGSIEEWPQGVFRISSSPRRKSADPGVPWTVTATDWSRRVARAGYSARYSIPKNTNVVDAIVGIVTSRIGDVNVQGCNCAYFTPRLNYTPADDPWAAITLIADGHGLDVYFDSNNDLVIRDRPTVTDTADLTVNASTVAVADAAVREDDETFANVVTVIATNPALLFAISATARDDNPQSPTYYLGPVGQHTRKIDNNTIFSTAAAQAMADAELGKAIGSDAELTLTSIPTHVLEAGDRIDITEPDLGIAERAVVDRVVHPLSVSTPATIGARLTGMVPIS